MDDEVIYITLDDIEVVDTSEYSGEIVEQFSTVPDVAKPLLKDAKATFKKIEQMLYSAPAIVNLVKANIPDVTLQAVLTDEQKQQIAKGALKLMTKKDGSLMANLVNPETKKIVATIPLKNVKMAPEVTQAMTNYATQMQMAQIAEQIQIVQLAVEEVRMGQEYDRLATAYSCQQKLLQAMEIKNPELRAMALIQIASDAEDSRNLLMLSQKTNVGFITDQPESFFGKIIGGATPEKINSRMNEIRESLCAVNMVSLAEAIAYQELGEDSAARRSLVGYKRDYDNDGNIIGYSRGHNGTRLDFLDYATRSLFKSSDRRNAEREIEKDYHFIEKVRLDYRNPSAHRDKLTITSAKNCIEYVIDVQHMLKEMLGTMKI